MKLTYVGADIALETFVASRRDSSKKGYGVETVSNTDEGIEQWAAGLDAQRDCIVLEATGVYHLRLAYALCERGIRVCVCNPLLVRRFAQMKGRVAKTDKLDAFCLLQYGEQEKPPFFSVPDATLEALRQRRSLLSQLQKRLQMTKNNLHHVQQHPKADALVKEVLSEEIAYLHEQIQRVQAHIYQVLQQDYEAQLTLLKTIPGVGDALAGAIIDAVNAFQGFDHCQTKQFVKHAGLCPNRRESGKSVRGPASISRSGTPELRAKLFLPALTLATRIKIDNPCKQLYQRLRAKGKSFKQAIVAVMHKLLRIAVAVLKSNRPYDLQVYGVPNYAK